MHMITTEQIQQWLVQGKDSAFYWTYDWKRKRREILAMDKQECQKCKARGQYTRATMVHHICHLRDCPELALNTWYMDAHGEKKRQLISLCDRCHEQEHPELRKKYRYEEPLTEEKW